MEVGFALFATCKWVNEVGKVIILGIEKTKLFGVNK